MLGQITIMVVAITNGEGMNKKISVFNFDVKMFLTLITE